MNRDAIVAEAVDWIDTPWRHQASCKGAGADCIGFIAGVYAACGSEEARAFLTKPRRYGRQPKSAELFAACDELMDRIPVVEALVGDTLIFDTGRHPWHFGLIVDGGDMVHAWLVSRRVTRHRIDDQWRARIVRAYRPRGIE